jgi:hypothetical protein
LTFAAAELRTQNLINHGAGNEANQQKDQHRHAEQGRDHREGADR